MSIEIRQNYHSGQRHFDEFPLQNNTDPLTPEGRAIMEAEYQKNMEAMAKDWERVKMYHVCIFCGEQSHEDGLIRNNEGYWIHRECDDYWKELEKLNIK